MMQIRTAFTAHPASVGETYAQHLAMAGGFATHMLLAALACYVHAFLPFLFERTGSLALASLYERLVMHRRRSAVRTAETGDRRDGLSQLTAG